MKVLLLSLVIMADFIVSDLEQLAFSATQEATVISETGVPENPMNSHSAAASTLELPMEGFDIPIMQVVGGLGLVLCLIVIGYIAAKKFAPHFFSKNPLERSLRVIETLPMGEKRSISMIQVEDKRFIVGNTPHQITLIASLSDFDSMVSKPETSPVGLKIEKKESPNPFRNLFEFEKKRTSKFSGKTKIIPEDIRTKMRQLRESLEG